VILKKIFQINVFIFNVIFSAPKLKGIWAVLFFVMKIALYVSYTERNYVMLSEWLDLGTLAWP
jgi:hypothetical protein